MPATSPLRCSHSVMSQRGANPVVLMDTANYPGFSNFLNQTWTWNGTTWARSGSGVVDASGPLPLRADFAMGYDGYNIMLFGGKGESSTSGVQSDTWTYNGSAWTHEAPATVPFGRFKSELALITAAGANKAVMFGGSNVLNFLNETWVWNGSAKTWTLVSPATSPQARVDHMFAGGPTFCVLFGGKNSNSLLGDTWKFDGSTWTQLTPTTPPSYRAEAAFCYDTANTQWVMFGGRDEFQLLQAETWTLNSAGTAWTKKAPAASPSARVGAQMCYDSQAGKVILFGGNDQAGNTFDDTWSWDGTVWVQL
jgi:hypothetical protein